MSSPTKYWMQFLKSFLVHPALLEVNVLICQNQSNRSMLITLSFGQHFIICGGHFLLRSNSAYSKPC